MTICTNLSDDQVKMAFSKFDTSGDDKLDYREFCEMIKQKVWIYRYIIPHCNNMICRLESDIIS